MSAYYNEIDSYAAQWLRNLIAAGHIAPGDVDERSIEDVKPDDLRNYTQCHFFAGIGVWSYALRNAGWPDEKPVWTGSCPCQPFSAAGKGHGFDDERHLWPAFHWLISECRPQCIFGEQVASGNANAWFDLVQADVEAMDYAFGLVPFPSAGVGAPHIRDRAYWVAHIHNTGLERWEGMPKCAAERVTGAIGVADRLANTDNHRQQPGKGINGHCTCSEEGNNPRRCGKVSGLGNTQHNGYLTDEMSESISESEEERRLLESQRPDTRDSVLQTSLPTNSFWRNADWLYCRDEKWRPVEPGTFPLADGASARVGRLRAYGNALNAEAAKAFINAYLEG
ncbi:DNA cytosine methyltransferase [Serratia symbiotica]|uniref:DNA cytosine methyltransferase n=1 Tax=Serratia symbiotica TaxID=138074 RepID=UPI0015D136B4|nr:DNA cytosine methyltransferase [Serratia symbiotica]